MAGCAVKSEQLLSGFAWPSGMSEERPLRWHQACFRLRWEGETPDFSLDALLAHRVVQPALEDLGGSLPLWRFHRRAVRDKSGHLFSLLYYSEPGVEQDLQSVLQDNETLASLTREGVVLSWTVSCRQPGATHAPGAFSDPAWDPRVQKSWPYFIMGVSLSWLALIDEVASVKVVSGADDLASLLTAYQTVDAEVTELWQSQGQHAYLHHLNAVFGYQPLWIRTPLRF